MNLLYIDLFCGAGGTSTGVNTARLNGNQCAEVIACVNHDANAIASHAANHPEALHFTEDIRTLDLNLLSSHVDACKKKYPEALIVLWASLECTNFSKAKGGQPRDADSRTLAEYLFRYIEAIDPDYIQIENVEEFMSWGDVDENGKPISRDKGRCYLRWVRNVKRYGYDYDYRLMNAADYGAYTSRKRFFGIFAKKSLPIIFPEPTHCKNGEKGLFGGLKKWKPVKDVLNFDDEGKTIFRDKPLSEKTLERIYAGLIKFVAGGKEAFLVKYNSMSQSGKYNPPGIDAPCPTVACQGRLGMAKVNFLSKQYSGSPNDKNISIEEPAGTITTIDHHAFITAYYKNGYNHPVELPCPTVTTVDRFGLIRFHFMDMQYGNGVPKSLEEPAGTITTNAKQNLVSLTPWIMDSSFNNVGSSIDEPARVITANRKWQYLMKPQLKDEAIEDTLCYTVNSTDGEMPNFIKADESGNMFIEIYPTDSPMTVLIKEFMALYGIMDIKMRMLSIGELKLIMGFPEDYVLIGTQADQKKFIGNAVEVTIARKWCESLCKGLKDFDVKNYKIRNQAA